MKKLLFATAFASTALASSMGCNTDTLTGLHFGLGVSVLFDKYEADVDVATIVDNIDDNNAKLYREVQFSAEEVTGDSITDSNAVAALTVTDWTADIVAGIGAAAGDNTAVAGPFSLAGVTLNDGETTNILRLPTSYVQRTSFKKRTTNCGGEVKLAYFHDFGNHLMVGVDLTGIIASKNKKSIQVKPSAITPITNANKEADLRYNDIILANGTAITNQAKALATTIGSGNVLTDGSVVSVTNIPALKAANPDFHTIMDATQLPEGYALKVDADNAGEVTFEKGVFNPRLAFIVGGTIYGWFAGLRMGMSYTTGKVYAKGLDQDKTSKTVSISSPLIGLHLMKQMKIAGNNDAHLYLTADWNIGDGRRTVDINGVKSFRQTGYNISAGLTWRFKLGN